MSELFTIDPTNAFKRFGEVTIQVDWTDRMNTAEASDVTGYGKPEEVRHASAMWLDKAEAECGHPITLHNKVLKECRNRPAVMDVICGGYDVWQNGVGPERRGRGLYLATDITYHQPPPLDGFFTVKDRLDGIFAIRNNAVVRYVADVFDKADVLVQTVVILCWVTGVAPEGLDKPPKSMLAMPDHRDPDHTAIHQLQGKEVIHNWGKGVGDPNVRHNDTEDPRGHGPCAISILTHDVLRYFADHDARKLLRLHVPGISNPFYQDDVVVSQMWRDGDKVVGRLIRQPGTNEEKVVLDKIEFELGE